VATQRIQIDEQLYIRLRAKAEADGKTVDELISATLHKSLGEESMSDMAARLQEKYAGQVDYTEEQVPDAVHLWRRERGDSPG
jgi:hypothetical protein